MMQDTRETFHSRLWLVVVALAFVSGAAACGDASTSTPAKVVMQKGAGAAAEDFQELLAYDWKIDAGVETYYCVYKTLTEDMWVSSFRPISPSGTHHVTLGFIDAGPADGVIAAGDEDTDFPCNGLTLGNNLAATGGVGTGDLVMPEGVAMKLPKGKQLLLSIHVLNASDKPLSGRTGYKIVSAKPEDVKNEAEVVAVNNTSLDVPPGTSTQTSSCTMAADATVFAVVAHMHYMGVHMKASATDIDGNDVSIVDKNYQFDHQTLDPIDPMAQLAQGSKIDIACDYNNTGDKNLLFGESTVDTEMCIAFVYRYPAVESGPYGYSCSR